jgi:hypothetical protein
MPCLLMERFMVSYAAGTRISTRTNGQLDGAEELHIGTGIHLAHSALLGMRNKKSHWPALCRWQWPLP